MKNGRNYALRKGLNELKYSRRIGKLMETFEGSPEEIKKLVNELEKDEKGNEFLSDAKLQPIEGERLIPFSEDELSVLQYILPRSQKVIDTLKDESFKHFTSAYDKIFREREEEKQTHTEND